MWNKISTEKHGSSSRHRESGVCEILLAVSCRIFAMEVEETLGKIIPSIHASDWEQKFGETNRLMQGFRTINVSTCSVSIGGLK